MLDYGCSREVFVERSLFHDDVQILLANNKVEIFEWIAVNQEQVGDVAFPYLTKFAAHAHHLPADAGPALQGFAGREAQQVDKVLEIASVVTLRRLGESVVSSNKDSNAALAQFRVDRSRRIDDSLHLPA